MSAVLKRLRQWMVIGGLSWLMGVTAHAQTTQNFDHDVWNRLVQQHVRWSHDGHASTVDYLGLAADKTKLQSYLAALSAVQRKAFEEWPRETQLSFLINAYNAFTVQLILTQYPDLKSIKDLGSFIQSPWKKPFVSLLGQTRSLDDIEHGLIRGSGRYRDPRIHFAVNCASIGCPALRPEAFLPERLNEQLEDQARRFLSDRTRNRIKDDALEVSPIFKWYREDFEQGFRGDNALSDFLARYAAVSGLNAAQSSDLRSGKLAIRFGDYDWRLNDGRR